jgi:hypothetical protein
MTNEAKSTSIALAGIAATALVGISALVASWLIAKADRDNQQALAHVARIFERRAQAYVDTIAVMETLTHQMNDLENYVKPEYQKSKKYKGMLRHLEEAAAKFEVLKPSMVAFGSNEAKDLFDHASNNFQGALLWAQPTDQQDPDAYDSALAQFEQQVHHLETVTREDLR